ncbi:unnamed protein product, partial [marine sediment metagenome]
AYVHRNSPAVDPELFVRNRWSMYCGGGNAYCVQSPDQVIGGQYCGLIAAGYLVNKLASYAGPKHELFVTPASKYWSMIFFVGGTATRDGSGFITAINDLQIPINRFDEFEKIILKYKTFGIWAAPVYELIAGV